MVAAQACYDMAKVFATPFISGKDSLNNEYKTESGESIAIPPTLLISAIAVMEDCRKAVTMDLKEPNNLLYMVGITKAEMGGSHYYDALGLTSPSVPQVDAHAARRLYEALHRAMAAGLVRSCHDCSEGGLAVALAEMAFAGGLGVSVSLAQVPRTADVQRDDLILFSESNSRFVVEIVPGLQEAFLTAMQGVPVGFLGKIKVSRRVAITGLQQTTVIDSDIAGLKESWQKTLRW
jgi:phosphoribosylformylglycinamidine synthase